MWRLSLSGALLAASAATAQDRPANPLIDALAACLDQRDGVQRLACLEAGAAKLVAAERARDVVVVTRDEVKRTRRSLFGLAINENDVFPGRPAAVERVDRLDTTVAAAVATGNDHWTLQLAEGGRWRTTEPWSYGEPRRGMAVEIRRAALGSYVLRSPGARAVRVMRVN